MAITYGKGGDGLLANHAHFFLIGMLSFYVYKNLKLFKNDVHISVVFISMAVMMRSIPLLIWAITFSIIITPQTQFGSKLYSVLNHKTLIYFGKISFPIYIVHSLIMHFSLGLPYWQDKNTVDYSFFIIFTSIFGTLIISHFLHYIIENPGINLGRHVALKLKNNRDKSPEN